MPRMGQDRNAELLEPRNHLCHTISFGQINNGEVGWRSLIAGPRLMAEGGKGITEPNRPQEIAFEKEDGHARFYAPICLLLTIRGDTEPYANLS